MPLASLANLQWNGPGAAATIDTTAIGSGVAGIAGWAKATGAGAGSGAAALAKATRLVSRPAYGVGLGQGVLALPKARGRFSATGKIGELSQDDVTGAVLEALVEDDLSLKAAIRLLLAHAAGNATGLESTSVAFRSLDGSKVRIAGTLSAGNRTITSRDGE